MPKGHSDADLLNNVALLAEHTSVPKKGCAVCSSSGFIAITLVTPLSDCAGVTG